jgi:hypothetical protein
VVISGVPFHNTLEPFKNPVPFTVSVKAPLAARTPSGNILVSTGAAGLIVKMSELDVTPSGLMTLKVAFPDEAIKLAGTVALNWLPLLVLS